MRDIAYDKRRARTPLVGLAVLAIGLVLPSTVLQARATVQGSRQGSDAPASTGGKASVFTARDAASLCAAVDRRVNRDVATEPGALDAMRVMQVPDADGARNFGDDDGGQHTAAGYVPIRVDGHAMAVVLDREGDSCTSELAYVWTADLKRRLSPDDVQANNPFQLYFGGNGWDANVAESMVRVDGRPLLLSARGGDFFVSRIDRDGGRHLACRVQQLPTAGAPVVERGDPGFCRALAADAVPVPMRPASGELRRAIFGAPGRGAGTFSVSRVGRADLDNRGTVRPVAILQYSVYSGGGCGVEHDTEFPLILDDKDTAADGAIDLGAPQLQASLHGVAENPDSLDGSQNHPVRVVRFRGRTYVEVLDGDIVDPDRPDLVAVQSAIEFTKAGPATMCRFQASHYRVTTVAPSGQP